MNIYSSKVRLNLASGGSIWAGLPGTSGQISKHLLRLPCVMLRSPNPPYQNFSTATWKIRVWVLAFPVWWLWAAHCYGCLGRGRSSKRNTWEGHKEPFVLGNLLHLSMIWHPKKCQCQTQARADIHVCACSSPGEPRGSQPAWKPSEISFCWGAKLPVTGEKP